MYASPILRILSDIAGSASAVAPELTPELATIATGNDLHIEFSAGDGGNIGVYTASGEIPFSIAFAEALWGLSYAFAVLPDMYQVHGALIVDRGNGRAAARCFDWSKRLLLGETIEWPRHLPKPSMFCFKSVRAANELFLAGTGWALLHEIGHVHLGHVELRPEDEETADAFASRWVLGWDPVEDIPSEHYWKRCAGTILVLLAITGIEFFHRTRGGRTHPDPVTRLQGFLCRYVDSYAGMSDEQKDHLWYAVAVMLYLFLLASRRNGTLPADEDARDLVDRMFRTLG